MQLLITAGPTREPIDAVRFISNRSSGKLGVALAQAGAARGDAVTLLLGPVTEPIDESTLPEAVRVIRFETGDDLQRLLEAHFPVCDALIMAAAVADYRPKHVHEGKLPRAEGGDVRTFQLEPTPDLIQTISQHKQPHQRTIAFALEEPANMAQRAAEKLQRKGVDAIVANALDSMGSDAIELHFYSFGGSGVASGRLAKAAAARWLLACVDTLMAE